MVENPHDKRFPVENRRRVGEPAVVKSREEPEIVDLFVVPVMVDPRFYRDVSVGEGEERADARAVSDSPGGVFSPLRDEQNRAGRKLELLAVIEIGAYAGGYYMYEILWPPRHRVIDYRATRPAFALCGDAGDREIERGELAYI